MTTTKRLRVRLLRELQALARLTGQRTTRSELLPVMIRRAPDYLLPAIERQVRAECDAQARTMLLAGGGV